MTRTRLRARSGSRWLPVAAVVACAACACAACGGAGTDAVVPDESPSLSYTTPELLTDPSLLQLADGSWLMAISAGQRTLLARSADGLHFTREATFDLGGVPELARAADGATRLYVCAGGIVAYRSTDSGRTWTREATVVGPGFNGHQIVCDPSLVAGAGLFVFKTGQ